jgi:20S proteasome alpha/beta subunit
MPERSRIVKPFFVPRPFNIPAPGTEPYNLPKRMPGVAVTIGAGFCCKDGVVLCADTQITWEGWYKRTASKITRVSALNDRLIFAHAGIVPTSKTLINRIARAVQSAKPGKTADFESLVQTECHAFKKERHEKFSPEILMAVRGHKRVRLYSITDFKLDPVGDTCCVGTGALVVNRILDSYDPGMTVKEATFVAAYVAKEAKDFGSNVGSATQIVQIFDDGEWDVVQNTEIERLEKDYLRGQELLGRLLTYYTPLLSPQSKDFKRDLGLLTKHLRKAHKERGHLVGKRAQEQADRDIEAHEQEGEE